MAKSIRNRQDHKWNELMNLVVHAVAVEPSSGSIEAQVYYNTTSKKAFLRNHIRFNPIGTICEVESSTDQLVASTDADGNVALSLQMATAIATDDLGIPTAKQVYDFIDAISIGVTTIGAGDGIAINQPTGTVSITNTDKGSSQLIFKTIAVDGYDNITANSNSSTLKFVAGDGIVLSTNNTTKELTIERSTVGDSFIGQYYIPGDTLGPVGVLQGAVTDLIFESIPLASITESGVVGILEQTFAGNKIFNDGLSGQLTGHVEGWSTKAVTPSNVANAEFPLVFSESTSGAPVFLYGVEGTGGVSMNPFTRTITANFKNDGGLSTEFLKADGSVDSNDYALTSAIPTDYIPLSGTTVGNPVIGDIEVSDPSLLPVSIYQGDLNGTSKGIRMWKDDNTFEIFSNEDGIENFTLEISKEGMSFSAFGDILTPARGITGLFDHSANITDFDYTQKIYVDTKAIPTISVTYSELLNLKDSSLLEIGKQYLLTDYMTEYTQPVTNVFKSSGIVEQLIITATDVDKLHNECKSMLYPQDVVYYEITGDIGNGYGVEGFTKGKIYRRIDTLKNNDIGTDWRHVKYDRLGVDKLLFEDYTNNFNNTIKTYFLFNSVCGLNFYSNTIGYNFNSNTVGDNFNLNAIGDIFNSNTIGNYFYSNIIGYNFNSNTVGDDFNLNTIGDSFHLNIIENIFYSNTIGYNFNSNTVGDNFYSNTIGDNSYSNTIGYNFNSNTIGNAFQLNVIGGTVQSNTIGREFCNNTIGYNFYSNTIGNAFQLNVIGENIFDFTFSKLDNKDFTGLLTTPNTEKKVYRLQNGDIILSSIDNFGDTIIETL